MYTRGLLENQEEIGGFSVADRLLSGHACDVETYIDDGTTRLVRLRPDGFSADIAERPNTVVFLEDRDQFANGNRETRFRLADKVELFAAARHIVLIHYRAARRLGRDRCDREHTEAISRILTSGGVAAVVKTTSDRARFWIGEARHFSKAECQLRIFDGEGVALVLRDWRAGV